MSAAAGRPVKRVASVDAAQRTLPPLAATRWASLNAFLDHDPVTI
jgi:hypothetical protein